MKNSLIIGGVILMITACIGDFKWYQLFSSTIIFLGGIILKEN